MQSENIYKRINFLFQAAYQSLKSNPNDVSLCRYYLYTLKAVARRQVLHLHHDMKRVMCKRCCVLLVPGVTASVRTRNTRHKTSVVTCLECGTTKSFQNSRTRIQWLDKEESWETIMDNGKMTRQQQGKGKNKQKQQGQKQKQQNLPDERSTMEQEESLVRNSPALPQTGD